MPSTQESVNMCLAVEPCPYYLIPWHSINERHDNDTETECEGQPGGRIKELLDDRETEVLVQQWTIVYVLVSSRVNSRRQKHSLLMTRSPLD